MARELLDRPDAAEYLGISTVTLDRWRWQGQGPHHLKVGPHRVRYDRADLDAFLDASRRRSTAETTVIAGAA